MKEAFIEWLRNSQENSSDVFFLPLGCMAAIGVLAMIGYFILEMTRILAGNG